MSPPADDNRPAKRPAERSMRGIYMAVGALLALGIGWAWWSHRVNVEHRKLLEQARQAMSELPVRKIPDDRNAARDYERAYKLFSMPARDISSLNGRLEQFEVEIASDEVRKMLTANASALRALAEAADKPECVFVPDHSKGYETRVPSLLDARAAFTLLAVSARRAAHEGNLGEAVERLRQELCLSRGIGDERMLMSHMIMCAGEETATLALRDILTATNPDASELRAMLGILEEHVGRRSPLRESLRVERRFGGLYAAEVSVGIAHKGASKPDWRFHVRRATGGILRDARAWARLWDRADAAMQKPYPEAFGECSSLEDDADYKKLLAGNHSPYSIAMVSIIACCRNEGCTIGQLRLARLAVACRLHQALTGQLPEKLDELAAHFPNDFAEVSTDPFGSRQMLYKRSETGFVVYSVGPYDQKDDGAPDPYGKTYEPDLTFPVDPKLWEEYRAKQLQWLKSRGPAKPGARPSSPPAAPAAP